MSLWDEIFNRPMVLDELMALALRLGTNESRGSRDEGPDRSQPVYPSTVSASRSLASLGSSPALRRARRWWSSSQHWSRLTPSHMSRCRWSGVKPPWDSFSNSSCSSWASSLIRPMTSWSSISHPAFLQWPAPERTRQLLFIQDQPILERKRSPASRQHAHRSLMVLSA